MVAPLESLRRRAQRSPDAVALIDGSDHWTCSRLVLEAAKVAAGLRRRDVGRGDRLALHMQNSVEAILTYLACWDVGCIAVPLNTRLKGPEIAALIERTRPKVFVGERDLYAAARSAIPDHLGAERCFVAGLSVSTSRASTWAELTGPARPVEVEGDVDHATSLTTPLVLLTTSGTTGASKLVVWTGDTLASFRTGAETRGMGDRDITPLSAPLMHAGGLTACVLAFLTGAVIVLLAGFRAESILDAIAAHRCTSLWLLPFAYGPLVQAQRFHPRDVRSLRLCMTGGDVCPTELEEAFHDTFGLPLLSMWGATEDARAPLPSTRPGPLTRMAPDTQVRLVDEDGRTVAVDGAGEMLIRSPGTTPGYWNDTGTIDQLAEGWFHTGDLLRWEADGHLRFLGRLKDLIVRAGSKVSPVEVEAVLRRQNGIADAAVAGVPDPDLGQRVGAILVLADNAPPCTAGNAVTAARDELADYKLPEIVRTVESIPRSAIGKIDRHAVARLLQSSAGNEVTAQNLEGDRDYLREQNRSLEA